MNLWVQALIPMTGNPALHFMGEVFIKTNAAVQGMPKTVLVPDAMSGQHLWARIPHTYCCGQRYTAHPVSFNCGRHCSGHGSCPAALTQRVHIRRIGCIVASAQHPPTARVPQPPRVDLTHMGCPALPDTEVRVARTGGPSPYMPALRVPCTHTTLAHVSGVAKQLCLPHTLPDKQAKRPANAHLHKCTVSSNPACVLEAEARTTKTPEGRAAGLHLTPSAHLARDVGEVVQDLLAGLVANVQPHMGVAAQHELRVDAA